MATRNMFRYLGSVWSNLPKADRDRFETLWKGYEQAVGDLLQRAIEYDLAVSVEDCPVFITRRWNKYLFDYSTRRDAPIEFVSTVDISEGVNLSTQYLLSFTVDGVLYEVDCRGKTPSKTRPEEIVTKINLAVGFSFVTLLYNGAVLKFMTRTLSPAARFTFELPSQVERNCAQLLVGLPEGDLPKPANKYGWRFALPQEDRIWHIPTLQNGITDEKTTLLWREGSEYIITPEMYVAFDREPPKELWARVTRVNEKTAAYNFGWLIDYVDNNRSPEDYSAALRGLWFSYWMGPRPDYVRRSLYLLFGLPVARKEGIIDDVVTAQDHTETSSVVIRHGDGEILEYVIPKGLLPTVAIGEAVERFQPLCDGIQVFDKVNLPGFMTTEVGRHNLDRFLLPGATDEDRDKALRLLEEHTFLPQISVSAFVRPNLNLRAIRTFLDAIKPLHKTYHLQMIVASPQEGVSLREKFSWHLILDTQATVDNNLYIKSQPETRTNYESGGAVGDPPGDGLHLDPEGIQFREALTIVASDRFGARPDLSRSSP